MTSIFVDRNSIDHLRSPFSWLSTSRDIKGSAYKLWLEHCISPVQALKSPRRSPKAKNNVTLGFDIYSIMYAWLTSKTFPEKYRTICSLSVPTRGHVFHTCEHLNEKNYQLQDMENLTQIAVSCSLNHHGLSIKFIVDAF